MRLTPEQQAALDAGDKVRVLAAAGAGKTTLLVERAATWAAEHGGSATMAVTFTRRAGEELRSRLEARGVTLGFIGTLHAYCYLALWRWGHRYVLLDETEMELVAKHVLEIHHMRTASTPKRMVAAVIGERSAKVSRSEQAAVDQLRAYMREQGLLYVGDVPYRWLGLAEKDARFLAQQRSQARCVLWDEYQDTNASDQRILDLLAPDRLFVIGDPCQAIYGFRGSSATYLLTRQEPVLPLSINWRSGPEIVRLGNRFRSVMAAHPGISEPATVRRMVCPGEEVASRLAAVAERARPLHVLCRTNRELRRISDEIIALSNLRVWMVSSRHDRFATPHWRAIFWLCQWSLHPERAWVRRQAAEILAATDNAGAAPPKTAAEAAALLCVAFPQDADRLELDALDFVRWYQSRDLQDQLPGDQHEAPDVVLMTVHAAKGLEFDRVAVVASHMPLRGQDRDEERNIFYVAITRAKRMLAVIGDGGFVEEATP
jgi:DNA helicase-2/ATP-dependent DNA helicase PcrA